jgi:hypothetical protein
MTKNILQNIALAGLSLLLASSTVITSIPTQAQEISLKDLDFVSTKDIGVYPCESEFIENVNQSRSWIIKNAKPGQTIETCVLVANPTEEAKTIKVGAQSAIATNDGAISMTSDGEKLTGLGSWIDLGDFSGTLDVNPGNGRELKFKIKVPEGTNAGEYAGAISIMEVNKDAENGGNFSIVRRYGSRIYVAVDPKEDFKLGTEFKDFEFILPGSSMYETYAKNARAYKWDDIVMTWKFNTTGNIFAKQTGKLTITKPDGETVTTDFSSDYFPGGEVFIPYVSTNEKYTVPGKYKARFDFKHTPTIPWNKQENVKDISSKMYVETEFEVTQAMLDQLKADKNTLETLLTEKEKEEAKAAEIKGFTKEEKLPKTGGEEKSDKTIMIVAGVAGAVIVSLIAIIAFILTKKKKEEKEAK